MATADDRASVNIKKSFVFPRENDVWLSFADETQMQLRADTNQTHIIKDLDFISFISTDRKVGW